MSRNSRARDVRRVAILFAVLFLVALVSRAAAVDSSLHEGTTSAVWRVQRGEDPRWESPGFDDSAWPGVRPPPPRRGLGGGGGAGGAGGAARRRAARGEPRVR